MVENFKSNYFYYKVFGDYALFTDPLTRGVGEKFSYSVPTYQALKGLTENLYWKPTVVIVIDEVKVMRPIRTQTTGVRLLIGSGAENSADRSYYTYLKNVEYLVKFHFEWNLQRDDLTKDRNAKKHEEILKRTLARGGRRDVFLGTRECVAFVEPLSESVYNESVSCYKDQTMNFGMMFHSFNYPTEAKTKDYEHLEANFTGIVMENGVIKFPRPEECTVTNVLSKYQGTVISSENIKSVDDELITTERM